MANIATTVYPLDYNRNNPMTGFETWRQYIHDQVIKIGFNSQTAIRHYNTELADDMVGMNRLCTEARNIVNK